MGIRDRQIPQDTRGLQTAQFISGASTMFRKGQEAARLRKNKEQKELQTLRRQASAATKGYAERRAKYKETGIKSLDQQIVEELDKKARAAANAYMKAFGPEGTEEDMYTYNQLIAQDAKDLDDLTVFVGTLDADLERRDDAIAKGILLSGKKEDGSDVIDSWQEKFKNGIINGDSEIKLRSLPDGGYEITGHNKVLSDPQNPASMADQTINLSDYHENFKKNGSSYIVANEELEDQMGMYGDNIVTDDLIKTMKVGFTGQKVMSSEEFNKRKKELETQKANATTPEDKKKIESQLSDLKAENRRRKDFKTVNRETAYANVYNKLNQDSKTQFKSYKKDGVIPREEDAWAFLQSNGYLEGLDLKYDAGVGGFGQGLTEVSEDVSWKEYNNPNKMDILNQAMSRYLVDNKLFQGVKGDVLETDIKYSQGLGNSAAQFNK